MIYFILYLGFFLLWITVELLRAPAGYEDENGFHIIEKPKRIKEAPGFMFYLF